MKSKLEKAKEFFEVQEVLSCPICKAALILSTNNVNSSNDESNNIERDNIDNRSYSLQCHNGHSYDVSKKGTVNFLKKVHNDYYSKSLFLSRREVLKSGMYNRLISHIADMAGTHFNSVNFNASALGTKNFTVLDCGCGEGFFLNEIIKLIREVDVIKSFFASEPYFLSFGIDLNKEAISLASDYMDWSAYMVGDLAHMPFFNESFDMILNIFSPANYNEFGRVLKKDGVVIKVMPGKNYLRELRELSGVVDYSNDEVMGVLDKKMDIISVENLSYQFMIEEEQRINLVSMTPLTAAEFSKIHVNEKNIPNKISLDFSVVMAKVKDI